MTTQHMPEDAGEIKTSGQPSTKFWFAVCEDVFDHEVVGPNVKSPKPDDPTRHAWQPFAVWLWLVSEAPHKPRKRIIQGQQIFLQRGQVAVSERYLAEKANWGRKSVRVFLEKLERFGMVTLSASAPKAQLTLAFPEPGQLGPKKGPAITVVTICNYDKYQHVPDKKGPRRAHEGPSRGPAGAQNPTTNTQEEDDYRGGDGVVVHLADRRSTDPNPFEITEDQFKRYHALGASWGTRPGSPAPLVPLDRALADSNLLSGLARFEGRAPELVRLAVGLTLAELEAKRHDTASSGANQGRGGLAPCSNYFSKTLNSQVDRLLLDAAKLEAAARTEMAVQQAVLEKRLNGVEKGGTSPRGRRSSWEDLGAEVYGTAEA